MMFETENSIRVDQGNLWVFINGIFIWYFNRNLLGVFYKTHLTFFFILLFIHTSEPVNMADIKNYINPEMVLNKYYSSQKMMLSEKNILDLWFEGRTQMSKYNSI